jgi:hypothetical protein
MADMMERDEEGNPAYAFKASLAGGMRRFTLKPDALHWQVGNRGGSARYDRIRAVRLSYRPVTMQSHRFVAEIWPVGQSKIQIVSVSWRSMMEQQRLDAAYAAFLAELHRRIATARGNTQLSAGLPLVIYWIGVTVFTAVLLATAALVVRAAQTAQWTATVFVALFLAVFTYQIGQYFYRNQPRRYPSGQIPAAVMPHLKV